MKLLHRNLGAFYYCPYVATHPLFDEDGYEVGSYAEYSEPILVRGNISASQGQAQTELFGVADYYTKVIIIDDVALGMNEDSVLFVETEPIFKTEQGFVKDPLGSGEIIPIEYTIPLYDYVVKRVAKSINSVSYAIDRVEVR